MSVTHMDKTAPAIKKPSIIVAVLLPVLESINIDILLPNPDRLINDERINTPMKKMTISLPKPIFTTFLNESTLKRAIRNTPRSPVIWKGITSVIQSMSAKSKIPSAFLPKDVSWASPVPVIDSGNGSFMTINIIPSATIIYKIFLAFFQTIINHPFT